MKRAPATFMTLLALLTGSAVLAMGILNGTFQTEEYRSALVLVLYGGFLAVLGTETVLARRADPDYRQVFAWLFGLLGIGLAMLGLFFSVMWLPLSQRAYGICLAVLLPLYGLALIMAAAAHHFLAQRAWRPFLYDFIRQLPYIYWRYRV